MRKTLRRSLFACLAVMLMLAGGQMMRAQDQSDQPTPQQMMERRLDRMKTQSGLADADWDSLKPKVQAVMEKQLPTMMGGMRGRSGGGGGGGQGGGGGASRFMGMMGPQMEELNALREAVNAEGATDDQIKPKLEAFVAAFKKRQAELKDAQAALAKAAGDKVKLKAVLMVNGLIPVE